MRLSVVVPATNAPTTLSRCLAAIEASAPPPDEIVVVERAALQGPAAARNEGVGQATGELVAFVDADVLVHREALAVLVAAVEADPGIVAAFGSYDDRVVTRGSVAAYRNLLHHVVHQRHPGPVPTFWAGLGIVRREAFLATGGFDAARYPEPSIEDIELGARLARHGTVVLEPRAQGTHLKEWTLRSMVDTDLWRRGVPWVELLAEHRVVPRSLNLGALERASAVSAVGTVAAALLGRPRLALACAAAQIPLNRRLFRLLLTRRGPRVTALGVGLHLVHQLTAAVAVPVGLARHAARRRPGGAR